MTQRAEQPLFRDNLFSVPCVFHRPLSSTLLFPYSEKDIEIGRAERDKVAADRKLSQIESAITQEHSSIKEKERELHRKFFVATAFLFGGKGQFLRSR